MANESDSLVLAQLREIRATLAGHSARFDRIDERFVQIDRRFDQLDKRFDDFHALVNHTLGLSTTNYLRLREFDQRHELGEGHQRRMDERMDEIERRLSWVEKKIDE